MTGHPKKRTDQVTAVPDHVPALLSLWKSNRRSIAITLALVALVKLTTWLGGYWMAKRGMVAFDAASYASSYHHLDLDPRARDPKDVEFFRLWCYSDAEWYLSIAASGYPTRAEAVAAHQTPAGERRSTERENYMKYAFFPLYPVLVAALATFLPLRVAAFLISLAASLGAAVLALLLYATVFRDDEKRALMALALLLWFPLAVFYSLYFPEGLFLLLSLLVFYGLQARRWPLVGVAGYLLSLTRPNGVFVLLPVLLVLWRECRQRQGAIARGTAPPLAWVSLIPLGFVTFMAVNLARVQDPVFFHTVQYKWRNVTADPLGNLLRNVVERITDFFSLDLHNFHSSQVDVAVMVVVAGILVAMWRDRDFPRELTLWATLLWVVPLVSKDLMSFSRYMCVSFPVFYFLARLRPRWVSVAILVAFCAAYGLALLGVVGYRWVG